MLLDPKLTAPLVAAVLSTVALDAAAQQAATTYSLTVTPIYEGTTTLDRGGESGSSSLLVNASFQHAWSRQWVIGGSLQYGRDDWRFTSPTAFGGQAPWDTVNRAVASISATYITAGGIRWTLAPQVEYAAESGATSSASYGYGALLMAAKSFSQDLTLGLGLGAFRRIEENSYIPFLIVDWQITRNLRLANPFAAGPAGGAGLELSYAFAPGWELGVGGAYRSYRFRLSEDGPTPNGIGEYQLTPFFLRAGYSVDKTWQLNFYAGAAFGPKLVLENAAADEIASDKPGTTPILGATISARF